MEGRRFFGRRPIGLSDGGGIDKARVQKTFDGKERGLGTRYRRAEKGGNQKKEGRTIMTTKDTPTVCVSR